jgi:hypothetical protein
MQTQQQVTPGYSWWLIPTDQKVAALYKEYTRAQIPNLTASISVAGLIVIITSFFIAYLNGEFKSLKEKGYQTNTVYFFLSCIVTVEINICSLISRKYSIASELVIPLICVSVQIFCTPFWGRDPAAYLDVMASTSWHTTMNTLFFLNLLLSTFYTSNYAVSVACR